jgi:SAM-dependent methyltransferase
MKREHVDYFERTWKEYDAWYDRHPALYHTELAALRKVVPSGSGLEIGVGTGRFAAPLAVRFGLDPALNMLRLAKQRGIRVVRGLGENLPFRDGSFDFVQIVFVLESLDDPLSFLGEAARTLRKKGAMILGLIDRDSRWGRYYARDPAESVFFHPPTLEGILEIFRRIGLEFRGAVQTLFQPPPDIRHEEAPREGFGKGGFVVLKAIKK